MQSSSFSKSRKSFTKTRKDHWDSIATTKEPGFFSRQYRSLIRRVFKNVVPEGVSILEIGCKTGDLLASLAPSYGLGVDFSTKFIEQARGKYPELDFEVMDAHHLEDVSCTFDYIIISDLVNDIYDIQIALEQVSKLCNPQTRIIINFFNHFWSLPINIARQMGLAQKILPQNWVSDNDLLNVLHLTGFDVVSKWGEILLPVKIPILDQICNRIIARLWPLSLVSLSRFFVARHTCPESKFISEPSVSIIVAARNEAGHISEILKRVPLVGSKTELIFVEGGSTDDTYDVIDKLIQNYEKMPVYLYRQEGKGKGDAVRLGFSAAQNDILMILDADLTVMPEDLAKFYNALVRGKGDFINGVRLVYPMEKKAMRALNLIGNKFFSLGFSYVLGQQIKDTLCGTKVLYQFDYEKIAKNRKYFGDFDPYGDFDLIFGAAKQNLKIVDMPVRYQARVYGDTNINRWEGGWMLLKMLFVAMKKLKFI